MSSSERIISTARGKLLLNITPELRKNYEAFLESRGMNGEPSSEFIGMADELFRCSQSSDACNMMAAQLELLDSALYTVFLDEPVEHSELLLNYLKSWQTEIEGEYLEAAIERYPKVYNYFLVLNGFRQKVLRSVVL